MAGVSAPLRKKVLSQTDQRETEGRTSHDATRRLGFRRRGLASPSSIAARSSAIFASYRRCSARAQRRHAHHFSDAGGAAGGNLCLGKATSSFRQVDVAQWYLRRNSPRLWQKDRSRTTQATKRGGKGLGENADAYES